MAAGKSSQVLEIKVTEVFDVTSFWAQIGTTNHFSTFKKQQKEISAWCEQCEAGCYESTASIKVEELVAVQGKNKGMWARSKVTKIMSDKLVELFYVDTGVTDYADIRSICAARPPMLLSVPQQALQCSLGGIMLPEGVTEWSKKVESRFLVLTSAHTKAIVSKILDGNCIVVSMFIPYKGVFTSVGEILKQEGLAEHVPCGPRTLDIPVPRDLVADNSLVVRDEDDAMPINCYITNTLLHQRQVARAANFAERCPDASKAEDTKTVSDDKEAVLSGCSVDCGPAATPGEFVVKAQSSNPDKAHGDGEAIASISAHPGDDVIAPVSADPVVNAAVPIPRTPSREDDSDQFEDINDSGLSSSPLLITENAQRKHKGLPEMVAMKQAVLQSTAGKDNKPAQSPEVKTVSQEDSTVKATTSLASKENAIGNRMLSLSDSGSELSDNDWLDEDLLPRRSGNSEVSDVQLESPVKDLRPVTPEGTPPASVTFEKQRPLPDKPTAHHLQLFPRNLSSTAGTTPHPRRPQVQLYTPPYTSRNLKGTFQNMQKDSWSSQGPPRGRGKGKGKGGIRRTSSEENKHQDTMTFRGRGRGMREKFSHRNSAQHQPPMLDMLVPSVTPGIGQSPDHSFNESQRDFPMGFNRRRPTTADESLPVQPGHPMGFSVRMPVTAVEKDHSSGANQHDNLKGYSTQRPAVPEHSSSDSPQKPVSNTNQSGSSPAYGQRLKGMSDVETDNEVRWQEWRVEEGSSKIFKSLSTESVGDFAEEIGKLLSGTAAVKLRELPKCRDPLHVVLECMVEKGVAKTIAPPLFMSALEKIVEGSNGAEVQKAWTNVIGKKSAQIIKSGSTEVTGQEGSTKCLAFCTLLGSLFCLPPSSSSKCREILIETVSCCLVTWTKLVPKDSDISGQTEEQLKLNYEQFERHCKLQVDSFGALLDAVYASPNAIALEEVMKLLLSGPITECVLCDYYPRHVRQAWHHESVKVRKAPPLNVTPAAQDAACLQGNVIAEVPGQDTGLSEEGAGPYFGMEWRQEAPNQFQGMNLNQPQQVVDDSLGKMEQRMELNCAQHLNADHLAMSQPPLPLAHAPTGGSISPQGVPQYLTSQGLGPGEASPRPADSYTRVMAMLESLHLTELFPKFTAAMIQDPVLDCDDLMGIKDCLKDAGIPSGPVLQILYHLENSQKLGSTATGRVQRQQVQGQRSRHPSQMSNPVGTPTLVQRALYLPSRAASPAPTFPHHPHYSPGEVVATNPYNIPGQQQQQQMVSPPYQVDPESQNISLYDTAVEGVHSGGWKAPSPLTTYRMQPPPLGKWKGSLHQQVQDASLPQNNAPVSSQDTSYHQNAPMPQQSAFLRQQSVPLGQQNAPLPQQSAPLRQQSAPLSASLSSQGAPYQMNQPNAHLQQQQQALAQQYMQQQNSPLPQSNAPYQQEAPQQNTDERLVSQQTEPQVSQFQQHMEQTQAQQHVQQVQPQQQMQQVQPQQQVQQVQPQQLQPQQQVQQVQPQQLQPQQQVQQVQPRQLQPRQQMQQLQLQQQMQQVQPRQQMQQVQPRQQMQQVQPRQQMQQLQPRQQMQQLQPRQQMQQLQPRQQMQQMQPRQQMQQMQPQQKMLSSLPQQMQPRPGTQLQHRKPDVQQESRGTSDLQQQQPTQQQLQQQNALQQQEPTQQHGQQQQQPQHAAQQQMPQLSSPQLQPPQQKQGMVNATGNSNLSSPVSVLSKATPPATRSSEWDGFNFPSPSVRKPKTSPAQASADTQFQLPASDRPQLSGFGRITCVICGGSDHVTPDCSQRSKFFTHM